MTTYVTSLGLRDLISLCLLINFILVLYSGVVRYIDSRELFEGKIRYRIGLVYMFIILSSLILDVYTAGRGISYLFRGLSVGQIILSSIGVTITGAMILGVLFHLRQYVRNTALKAFSKVVSCFLFLIPFVLDIGSFVIVIGRII